MIFLSKIILATAGVSLIDNSCISLSNLHKCQDLTLYLGENWCIISISLLLVICTAVTVCQTGGMPMSVSYNKLWKLLIDHNMNKSDLGKAAKMSPNTIAKLGKNESVSLDILVRICEVLNCDIGDIVEVSRSDAG